MKLTEENGEKVISGIPIQSFDAEIRKAPPLGAPPLFILVENRINEITEAIQRMNCDTNNYKAIGDLAYEIMVLADACRKVTERRREK